MKLLLTLFLFLASNAGAFDVVGSLPQGLGDGRYVQKAGDTMSGQLTVASSVTVTGNAFSVGVTTLVVANGKVGIGTTTPLGILEVDGRATTGPTLRLYQTTWTDNNILAFQSGQTAVTTSSITWQGSAANFAFTAGRSDLGAITLNTTVSGTVTERVRVLNGGTVAIVSGGLRSYSRTMAQLLAITPLAVGEQYFCNNCTPAKMVVSTGTSAGNFADIMGGTFQ